MRRHAGARVQAEGCRALGGVVVSEERVVLLVREGGLELLLEAEGGWGSDVIHGGCVEQTNGGEEDVRAEVSNLLERLLLVMCEQVGGSPPSEELEVERMAEWVKRMAAAAERRREEAAAERARVEEEGIEVARKEEEKRLVLKAAVEARRFAAVEGGVDDSLGFCFGGVGWDEFFNSPCVDDAPRLVELDD